MKKGILLVALLLTVFGCRSTTSLDRRTPASKNRRVASAKQTAPTAKKKKESVDPAFDLMFRRKHQRHGASIFSEEENRRLRGNREADEATARSVRGEERLTENSAQRDWVFGTKDGKYF